MFPLFSSSVVSISWSEFCKLVSCSITSSGSFLISHPSTVSEAPDFPVFAAFLANILLISFSTADLM
jgi:hypothetical protein